MAEAAKLVRIVHVQGKSRKSGEEIRVSLDMVLMEENAGTVLMREEEHNAPSNGHISVADGRDFVTDGRSSVADGHNTTADGSNSLVGHDSDLHGSNSLAGHDSVAHGHDDVAHGCDSVAVEHIAGASNPIPAGMSKNAYKKMIKAARMEELKPLRRQKEKEKKQAKKRETKQLGAVKSKPKPHYDDVDALDATVVIDLGFDDLMTDREVISMAQQLGYVYSSNRFSLRCFRSIVLTGQGKTGASTYLGMSSASSSLDRESPRLPLLESRLGKRMEGPLRGSWRRWKGVQLRPEGGIESIHESIGVEESQAPVCAKEKMVYLTADTDNVLEDIQEGYTYIIGGLVDRNRYKVSVYTAEKSYVDIVSRTSVQQKRNSWASLRRSCLFRPTISLRAR